MALDADQQRVLDAIRSCGVNFVVHDQFLQEVTVGVWGEISALCEDNRIPGGVQLPHLLENLVAAVEGKHIQKPVKFEVELARDRYIRNLIGAYRTAMTDRIGVMSTSRDQLLEESEPDIEKPPAQRRSGSGKKHGQNPAAYRNRPRLSDDE